MLPAAEAENGQVTQAIVDVFHTAALEHAKGFSLQDAMKGINGAVHGKLASPVWPLRGINAPHKALNRSSALMEFSKRVQEGDATQVATYCRAAGAMLSAPQATQRALACEFLAYFPVETITTGFLPAMGELLADDADAFPGIDQYRDPSPGDDRQLLVLTTRLTVGEIARAAIFNMVYLNFDTRDHFRTWWKANPDYTRSLWYWTMRFQGTEDDWAQLDTLPAEQAVKILLLLNNEVARQTELTASWKQAGAPVPANFTGGLLHTPYSPTVNDVAQYISRRKQHALLLNLMSGKIIYPEVNGGGEALLGETIAKLMPSVLTKINAPAVLKIANEKRGLAAFPIIQADLILVAALLDPVQGESLLRLQLERTPERWDMAIALLQLYGVKHWETIRRGFAKYPVEGQCMLIRQLGALNTPQARKALGDLLTADRLEAAIEPSGKVKAADAPRAARLHAYFITVQAMNDNTPVVDPFALETATRYQLKKDSDNREAYYAPLDLFPARALVIKRLKAFFTETEE